jgi:hypothetical protein
MSDLYQYEGLAAEAIAASNAKYRTAPVVETRLTRECRKMRDAVAQARDEMRHANISQEERLGMNNEIFNACAETVRQLVAEQKVELQAQLDRERSRIARDRELNATKYDAEIRAASLRFSGMTLDELERTARDLTGSPRQVMPEIIDSLSAELRLAGSTWHGEFRKEVTALRLYEAERFTEAGAKICHLADVLQNSDDGTFIPLMHEDGAVSGVQLMSFIGGGV